MNIITRAVLFLAATALLVACGGQTTGSGNDATPPLFDEGIDMREVENVAVTIETVETVILESFPVQVRVQLSGMLPNSCSELLPTEVSRDGDTFVLTQQAAVPVNTPCTMEVAYFEESVGLDVVGLPAGTYTVEANGVRTTFTLDVDNTAIEDEPPATVESDVIIDRAYVDSVTLLGPVNGNPDLYEIEVAGNYADGCTEFSHTEQRFDSEGNYVYLTIYTQRPRDAMCTEALVPFTARYEVDVRGVDTANDILVVNDVTVPFGEQ